MMIWAEKIDGYTLLDSGNGQKLEEIDGIRIIRDEPRAWWRPKVSKGETLGQFPKVSPWETVLDIGIGGVKAKIKYKKNSKHIGIFPEQASQWKWIFKKLEERKLESKNAKENKVLSLFGYTGIASLVAAKTGAKVTHVDGSKQSIEWARENQKLSGLEDAPIRWILDDALKFIRREAKRGEKYDCIIMDPPSFGHGPKGEVWKVEEDLVPLLEACREVLSEKPLFVILNMYSTELSAISLGNLLSDMTKGMETTIEVGELAIPHQNDSRLLPLSIFALALFQ